MWSMCEGRKECPGKRDRKKCKFLQISISVPFLMLTQIDRTIIPEMRVGHSKSMHINYLYSMTIIYAVLRGSSEKK